MLHSDMQRYSMANLYQHPVKGCQALLLGLVPAMVDPVQAAWSKKRSMQPPTLKFV